MKKLLDTILIYFKYFTSFTKGLIYKESPDLSYQRNQSDLNNVEQGWPTFLVQGQKYLEKTSEGIFCPCS
jgi:hypothetical protein